MSRNRQIADDYEWRVRNEAERLFTEHNRAKGALMPWGLGWLSPAAKEPWLEKARESLAKKKEARSALSPLDGEA